MSRHPRRPVQPSDVPYTLFRRAAVPALMAATVCVVVAAVRSGAGGAIGALLGALIVLFFYVADLVTLRFAERRKPESLMPLMMTEYIVKVILLALLLVVVWDTTAFSVRAMAGTVAVATVVWIVALAVSAMRVATFVVDVSAQQPPGDS